MHIQKSKFNGGRILLFIGLILVFGLIFVWGIYQLHISKYNLDISFYTISSDKITTPFRIVQLTDLHNSEFGEKNAELVSLVAEQNPDMILLTGDFVNADDPSARVALELIPQLADIAELYISNGNHEVEYDDNFDTDIDSLYIEVGAKILESNYEDIEINGQKIRLGGIYGYCLPEKYIEGMANRQKEAEFLSEFQNTDLFTVLMAHMPACWIVNDGINEWDIDCIFAGHAHGGQIRLPFIGGLYAPDHGWFPGEMCGLYYSNDNK